MTKEYLVYRDTVTEALQHLDEFDTKMQDFLKENPEYSYSADISKSNDTWEISVKLTTNEQINIKAT
jgi:CHASE3 domain sensor protein